MDAFLFSFNAVFPIFLVMALGYLLKRFGIISDAFIAVGTKIVFTVAIPCMLLPNILDAHIDDSFDPKLTLFAIIATLVCVFVLRLMVPRFVKGAPHWTAYIQGAFRSNYLIIGLALSFALGGDATLAKSAMLLVFVVPLYNLLAVLVLSEAKKDEGGKKQIWRQIYTNPVIITTTLAIILALLNIQLPSILRTPIDMLGNMALPLSLITLGASISFKHCEVNIKHAISASLIRVLVIPLLLIPIACWLGFRGVDLIICLILFASPSAVSCFPMAYQMGADYRLSGMIIAFTNTMAIFTLFVFVYILRVLALI